MKLVVSHLAPDFDALASLALAQLLHPGAVAVLGGQLEEPLASFVHLYRDALGFMDAQEVNLEDVRELIVVDTASRERIAPFDALVDRVPVTLYDHHPRAEGDIAAAHGSHQRVGSAATILTLLLVAKEVEIPPELASLALLGIHSDTGNLTYSLTRPEDYEASAHLLRAGASLDVLQEFSREHLGEAHREVLARLLQNTQLCEVRGHKVAVATLREREAIQGLAPLCAQLLTLHEADAALIVAEMNGKTGIIARAKEGIDVGAALRAAFEGGGHPGAAFARTDLPLEEALHLTLAALEEHSLVGLSARDLMSFPVKTVLESDTLGEALELLLRHGHNGLPVVNAENEVTGVISRRDLDKALRHGLGSSQVRGYMTKQPITAPEETPQRDLEALIKKHNIGRVPILREGRLVGIVTRSDLISARHDGNEKEDVAQTVLSRLPTGALEALEVAKEALGNGSLYLVGGTVRDALLGASLQDLDMALEGVSAQSLGTLMQRRLGGSLSCHMDFGTCTLTLPSGLMVDLASAREEVYLHPGALPTVSPSSLRKDLSRRDFTLNTLAVRVSPGTLHFIDPYGGLQDLNDEVLRSLHPLSFVDDPTRIIRGARLGGRLGFTFHPDTLEQIFLALDPELLKNISRSRLRAELLLTLAEPRVSPALKLLAECGALEAMFTMHYDEELHDALDELHHDEPVGEEAYLLALLLSVPEEELEEVANRYNFSRRLLEQRAVVVRLRNAEREDEAVLEKLMPAVRTVLKAANPSLRAQIETLEVVPRKRLRGQDVLDLGILPGPDVGEVLAHVARARAEGTASTYEEELEVARAFVETFEPSRTSQE